MRLVILFYMFFNPRFKITAVFANIARTTASTSNFIHQERPIESFPVSKKYRHPLTIHLIMLRMSDGNVKKT